VIHIGIDPGKVGAAVAMDDANDGEVIAAVHWNERRAWYLDDDEWATLAQPSMIRALSVFASEVDQAWCDRGASLRLVVEAVTVNKGKGNPIALATSAGIAIGLMYGKCRIGSLHRPRPEHWRKVFTGRGLNGRRAELKAAALAWAAGRTYPGLHDLRLHPGGRVLPDGPDHAAEAAAMAWASVRGVV